MDKSLGDIMTKLEQLGVAEKTLIVFLSDNGGDAPFNNGNAPLRGKKAMRYEGGIRVPMIAAWAKPDGENPFQTAIPIPAASRQDDLVHIADIFPTFLFVAGLDFEHDIDGHDLVPYLKAQPGPHRPQSLVTHFPHSHNNSFYTTYHQGHWKLIFNYGDGSYELYNLAQDIGENNNLAAAEPDRATNMARALALQLEEKGAQYPQNLNTASPQPPPMPEIAPDPGTSFRAILREHDGRFVLSWPSRPGAVYRIESNPDLVGAWSVIADNVFSSVETAEFDFGHMPMKGRSFFRVVWK
jgi:arylsulfatase A-like enzyme